MPVSFSLVAFVAFVDFTSRCRIHGTPTAQLQWRLPLTSVTFAIN